MKIAFLTEMSFEGKIPETHRNMRTEFAWMFYSNADHFCIRNIKNVKEYDKVFIIFPKGRVYLSAEGSTILEGHNPSSELLDIGLVEQLRRQSNLEVNYIQEGPHWWFTDYEVLDQIRFYNFVSECDFIFAHNESDTSYYRGLFSPEKVRTLPTMMVDKLIQDIQPTGENKVIIGGNFARWYGGFESYIVASEFNLPIWAQTSHAMRKNEKDIEGLFHLPRLEWVDWMKELSKFKFAVHLMPTVAAGTFSLNCAYFGIPCIGNEKVDTQRICHPKLSVDVDNIETAKNLAKRLKEDSEFYQECSILCKQNYHKHYNMEICKDKINYK